MHKRKAIDTVEGDYWIVLEEGFEVIGDADHGNSRFCAFRKASDCNAPLKGFAFGCLIPGPSTAALSDIEAVI